MDTMLRTLVLSFPVSSVSQELQDIFEVWHRQSGGPRAVPHPGGEELPSPVLSMQSVVWGGCSPPVKKQGLAPGSSEAQWLQRVAPSWPKDCPGSFVQACEGPQGEAPHCRLCVRSEEALRDGTSLAQEQSCVCFWCSPAASLVPDAAGLHQV